MVGTLALCPPYGLCVGWAKPPFALCPPFAESIYLNEQTSTLSATPDPPSQPSSDDRHRP
jgi:hypothetical protein